MEYLNFDLEITRDDSDVYTANVLASPGGEAREIVKFPFKNDQELENYLIKLRYALVRSGGSYRLIPSEEEEAVQNLGKRLYNEIFKGKVGKLFNTSREKAVEMEKGLRIRMRIHDPNMAALPWEFLYDGEERQYLCLSTDTPIIRYISLGRTVKPIAVKLPLRILVMIASPSDLPKLDIEKEKQRLEEAMTVLKKNKLVELCWIEGQSWHSLQKAMKAGPWHIFHFIGHGGFDHASDEGIIALCDEENKNKKFFLRATQLALLLGDHHSLRLVVLNSCNTAKGSDIDVFSSTASILVQRNIPAVVAMQYEITDKAAIEFTRTFYESLVELRSVDMAVTDARKAINLALNNSVEWGTPVLYMRTDDGHLFDFHNLDISLNQAMQVKLSDLLKKGNLYRQWDEGWSEMNFPHLRLSAPVGIMRSTEIPGNIITWEVNLTDKDGHLWVNGAPGSGKTTFLRTLILSLAMSHTPADIQFYILDFGNLALSVFDNFPHCGGVILINENERIERLFGFLEEEMKRRFQILAETGFDSSSQLWEYNTSNAFPAIVVIIDNFLDFADKYLFETGLVEKVNSIIRNSASVDIHFIITTSNPVKVNRQISESIANRISFRSVSPDTHTELLMMKPDSANLETPGTGLIKIKDKVVECKVAWPTDGEGYKTQLKIKEVATEMANCWTINSVHEIYALPKYILFSDILPMKSPQYVSTQEQKTHHPRLFIDQSQPTSSHSVLVGVEFEAMIPIWKRLSDEPPTWLLLGPRQSGKTNALLSLAFSLLETTPNGVEIEAIAMRPGLLSHLAEQGQLPFQVARMPSEICQIIDDIVIKRQTDTEPGLLPLLLIIDDLGAAFEPGNESVLRALNNLASCLSKMSNIFLMVSALRDELQMQTVTPIVRALRQNRNGLCLSRDQMDADWLGAQLSFPQRKIEFCLGRAFFISKGSARLVQIPLVPPIS